jgi:hypothetical protein
MYRDNTSTGNSSPLLQQYTTFLEDYTNKRSRSVTGTTEANTSETISSHAPRSNNGVSNGVSPRHLARLSNRVSRRHVAQLLFQSPRTKTEDMSTKVSAKAEISAKISAKICSALHKVSESRKSHMYASPKDSDVFRCIQLPQHLTT